MANQNIQMTQRSTDNTSWNNLFPYTQASNIVNSDGTPDYVNKTVYAVTTGSANTYAITLSPVPTAYVDGMSFVLKINATNTGSSTLNVNSLGAKTIKDMYGNNLYSGFLVANRPYQVRYESSSGIFIVEGNGNFYSPITSPMYWLGN